MTKKTILCIEDDALIADLLSEVLCEAGFSVDVAEDGVEGLGKLRSLPDLVICDIDLPILGGLEVLETATSGDPSLRAIPFIFLTAFADRANQIRARQLGCHDFVTKPVDLELLIAVVRNVLNRGHSVDRAVSGKSDSPAKLTQREREVIGWIAKGKSSSDIASIIGLTERTINFHVDKIMRKLDVSTRIQAVVACVSLGIIDT